MDTIVIIVSVILAISILSAYVRIIKKGFRLSILFPVILSGMVFAAGLSLNTELASFKQLYPVSSKIILLEQDGSIIAGFSGIMGENTTTDLLPVEELAAATTALQADNKDALMDGHYKLFVIQKEAFDGLPDQVYFHGQDHNKTTLLHLLVSGNATTEYVALIVQRKIAAGQLGERYRETAELELLQALQEQIGGDAELRSSIFVALVTEALFLQGQGFIVLGLKHNTIMMYPEENIFKIMKLMPSFLLEQTI